MEYITNDPAAMPTEDIYKFLVSTIVPRPIALVTTLSSEGVVNCAPFSSFNLVASEPPTLLFTVYEKVSGEKKDTLRNIEALPEFGVNIPQVDQAAGVALAGAPFPYGESELLHTGWSSIPSLKIRPPRIAGTHTQFECELYKSIPIGDKATVIIGRILCMHITRNAYDGVRINEDKIPVLSRLGGSNYADLGRRFLNPIPKI